ncbi:hypothetical protein AC35_5672 [Escherichia coli 3-475-03_S3_C2]|nr:hypothetical protein AB98_5560 [Escherichia coli 1-176-05_S3_C1]KDW52545.1 hypothetical protein AB82_4742 [Escherichia coli 2-005-03_S3_C1]KDW64009.1 hypothetical protein AC40_4670 [Escherichia coli 2-005-03_S3_C3]KDY14676.1 hypothetical protein AD30_4811 [Escherichia coli 2-316-03_S4_C3]KEJ15650.1 hypothetical protein AB50_1779 [Escherichia coli 6-175-07_S1_C2]KEJ19217.1 hypothetical protein AC79_5194 [Escherichia coli 8-415-05_S4_C1]KEJ19440.1 hypothetical protein AD07_5036 [Escherichia 
MCSSPLSENTEFKKGNSGEYGIVIQQVGFIFSHIDCILGEIPVTEQNTNIKAPVRRINVW